MNYDDDRPVILLVGSSLTEQGVDPDLLAETHWHFRRAGSSNMATGTARLFGYRFRGTSIIPINGVGQELCRRWYISSSFWLRNYSYIAAMPLVRQHFICFQF